MEIVIGKTYRHYKNKKQYSIIALAKDSGSLQNVVVYQGQYDDEEFGHNPIWVRPYDEFAGTVEYEGKIVPRFTFVADAIEK